MSCIRVAIEVFDNTSVEDIENIIDNIDNALNNNGIDCVFEVDEKDDYSVDIF